MEKNYAYEVEKAIKEKFKESKKKQEKISLETKKNLLKLVNNCSNSIKIEYIYKFRYIILNRDITKLELTSIYEKLFKKIINTNENSIIFTEWNNIFSTIFSNLPVIYDSVGILYINRIVDLFNNTNNENKLRCLMNLFLSLYEIAKEDLLLINLLLIELEKEEKEDVLNNYNLVIKNIYKFTDNNILKNYFEYIICQITNSISKQNSEYLSDLIKFLTDDQNDIEKEYTMILLLLKTFATTENKELIYAYHSLISDSIFLEADSILQNKCMLLLKKIADDNFIKIRLVTQIIKDIIIICDNKEIQNYLLNKLIVIKNNETLELILKLNPLLSSYTDDKEFIRVINHLEDNNNNFKKKLIINIDNKY